MANANRPLFLSRVTPNYFVVEPKPVYERMYAWEKTHAVKARSPKELREVKNRFSEIVRAEDAAMIAAGLPRKRFAKEADAKTYAAKITAACNVVPSVIEACDI